MRRFASSGRSFGVAGKRTARGLGTVYKEAGRRTRWVGERWVRLADGTRRRVRVRAVTQDEAIAALEAAVAQARLETKASTGATLNRMLDDWLAWVRPTLRESSYLDYSQAMRLYVRDELGALPLSRVTPEAISDALANITRVGHVATAHKVRRLLSQAFLWGVRRGRVASNPVARVESVKRRKAPVQAWNPTEATRFLQAARGDDLFPLFYTAMSTGMRKGELLALRWVDVRDGEIFVRRTVSKGAAGGVAEGAKTIEGTRRIPISPDLAVVLDAQRAATTSLKSPLVFPSWKTCGLMSGSHVSKRLRALIEAAGVPSVRFHDLRKTSASLLARAGVPPAVIQARLGHSDPSLALRVYTRVFEEDANRAVLDLGGIPGGLPTERRYTRRGVRRAWAKAAVRPAREKRGGDGEAPGGE